MSESYVGHSVAAAGLAGVVREKENSKALSTVIFFWRIVRK